MFAEAVAPFSKSRFITNKNADLFDLSFGKIEGEKFDTRFFTIGRSANNANELIQVRQGNQITMQRFRPLFRLAQFKTGAAKNDFASVLDVRLVSNFEWQQFWPAVIDCQHVHSEGRFHRGVLVEIVNYNFRISVAL